MGMRDEDPNDDSFSADAQDHSSFLPERKHGWGGVFVMALFAAVAIGKLRNYYKRLSEFRQHESFKSGKVAGDEEPYRRYYYSSSSSWSTGTGKPRTYEWHWYREGPKKMEFDWDEFLDEVERKERIRWMRDAFRRERSRTSFGGTYETWRENQESSRAQEQWGRTYEGFRQGSAANTELLRRAKLRQHYNVLGLDPTRSQPYTEAEVKAAFREKAMKYHPDRNPNDERAKSKFREVMDSYEAIKSHQKSST